jgi:hypothetical protein
MPAFWVLRDAYRDVGARAKHGADAEKVRMRGYKIRQLHLFYPLSPALSRRERGFMGQL